MRRMPRKAAGSTEAGTKLYTMGYPTRTIDGESLLYNHFTRRGEESASF